MMGLKIKLVIVFFTMLFTYSNSQKKIEDLSYFIIEKDHKDGLINNKGEIIVPFEYIIKQISDSLYFLIKEEKGYVFNTNTTKITKSEFRNTWPLNFSDTLFIAVDPDCHYITNIEMKKLFRVEDFFRDELDQNHFKFELEDFHGIRDFDNNVIVNPNYDHFISFSYEGILSELQSRSGLLAPFFYKLSFETLYDQNHYLVEVSNQWGLFDKNGREKLEVQYNFIWGFNKELYLIYNKNNFGLWNISSNEDPRIIYQSIGDLNQWDDITYTTGLLNAIVANLITAKYSYKSDFGYSDNTIRVKKDNKWGYLDSKGQPLIPFKYDYALNFNDGFASVNMNGRWGVINKKGEFTIKPKYDSLSSFIGNHCFYKVNNHWGITDYNDNITTSNIYKNINQLLSDLIIAKSDNGILLFDGNINRKVLSVDSVEVFNDSLLWALKDGRWTVIDRNGTQKLNLKFDEFSRYKYSITPNGTRFIRAIYQNNTCLLDESANLFLHPIKGINFLWLIDEDLILVSKNEDYGIISINKNIKLDIEYERIWIEDEEKIIYAQKDNQVVCYDFNLNKIFSFDGVIKK